MKNRPLVLFLKIRYLLNLWSIKQQIHLTELMVDHLDSQIKSAQDMCDYLKEFLPHNSFEKKVQKLKEDRNVLTGTLEVYHKQESRLRHRLVA